MFALSKTAGKIGALKARSYLMPKDGKTGIGYFFWNLIDRVIVDFYFNRIDIVGSENLPAEGPFILVSNHSSRWDGPLVQHILNRPANYMVSPNEMRGLQGAAVMSVGAFPANPRLDLINFANRQLKRGEPVVIFPEGNVFCDGVLHTFKKGVARIALAAARGGLDVPVVPIFIRYSYDEGPCVKVVIGKAIGVRQYAERDELNRRDTIVDLAERLFHEVQELGTEQNFAQASVLDGRFARLKASA